MNSFVVTVQTIPSREKHYINLIKFQCADRRADDNNIFTFDRMPGKLSIKRSLGETEVVKDGMVKLL